jgi:myo-inositol-1-phosphate synthase
MPKVPDTGVKVIMGQVLDGVADHMTGMGEKGFVLADAVQADKARIVKALKDSGAEVLLNFLPVGSQDATEFYMECALEAGVAVVNCMPVFIASRPEWEKRFRDKRIPIVGDDVKAQLGATIVHRVLSSLFGARGVNVERTYQLNTGGNTDFMNMLDRQRLGSKKESKTEAVQAMLAQRLADENIHVGPSDYVPWQKDNKLCFLRMEGQLFGGVPMNLELRLSVEDSPNSAAVVMDAIRCCKLALDRGEGGALIGPSAYFCKHPPEQFSDDLACGDWPAWGSPAWSSRPDTRQSGWKPSSPTSRRVSGSPSSALASPTGACPTAGRSSLGRRRSTATICSRWPITCSIRRS